jgi:hypothetical protein
MAGYRVRLLRRWSSKRGNHTGAVRYRKRGKVKTGHSDMKAKAITGTIRYIKQIRNNRSSKR